MDEQRSTDGDHGPAIVLGTVPRMELNGTCTQVDPWPASTTATTSFEQPTASNSSDNNIDGAHSADDNRARPFGKPVTTRAGDASTLTWARRSIGTLEDMSTSEKELKLSLYFHISNPFTRLTKFHRFPLKFAVHLIKTFCIVTQAILFIESPSGLQSAFRSETERVFSTLLVQPDVISSTGGRLAPSTLYTAYRIQDVKAAIDFAGFRFGNLSSIALGLEYTKYSNGSPLPIEVALTEYTGDKFDVATKTVVFNAQRNTSYFWLDPKAGIGIVEQLSDKCADNCVDRFLTLDITFRTNDIRIKQPTYVQCYNVTSMLRFAASGSRTLHTYYVAVDLKCMSCQNYISVTTDIGSIEIVLGFRIFLSVIVFAVCIVSFYLTLRALVTSYRLAKAMGIFYRNRLHKELSRTDRLILFEYWHAVNILSDLCTVVGTILVILFDQNLECTKSISYDAEEVRILLGIGIIIQAAVILRYVSYFPQFNVLSRALEIAVPRLMKYIIFATILFTAFMITGWLVLSPFHYKFSSINKSFYTLFTMLNGDDLYNTFVGFNIAENTLVYVFGQAFFTIFMALFIYAILNLFVSLIVEAREESQDVDPLMKNEVRRFVFSGPLTDGGVALRDLKVVPQHMYVEPDVILQDADPERDHD